MKIDANTALEAKAVTCLAFRNGPIEDIHSGKICPTCHGRPEYSHVTDAEMKIIMKTAVDRMATLLTLRESDPERYARLIMGAMDFVQHWDSPRIVEAYLRNNEIVDDAQ